MSRHFAHLPAELLKHSFNRPNIKYICKYKDAIALSASDLKQEHISEGVARDISDFIVASRNSGIIYARTRCDAQPTKQTTHLLIELIPWKEHHATG